MPKNPLSPSGAQQRVWTQPGPPSSGSRWSAQGVRALHAAGGAHVLGQGAGSGPCPAQSSGEDVWAG